jgi:hypothetical protein
MSRMPERPDASRVVVIRPVQPVGVAGARVPGGLQSVADRVRIDVDTVAGQVHWTRERSRSPVVLRLPGSGAPPAEVLTRVVVVGAGTSALYADVGTRRIVFVDGTGRSPGSSVPLSAEGFDHLWPAGIFDPLASLGVAVESLQVRDQHAVNRAFPGASRHWRLVTWPYNWLIYAGWVLGPAAVLVLLIGCGVFS